MATSNGPQTHPAPQGAARPTRVPVKRLAASLLLIALVAAPAAAAAQGRWVGTWTTGPLALDPPPPGTQAEAAPGPGTPVRLRNQTIRQFVRTSIGGSQVRVALTNLFGTAPLQVGAAHVARRGDGAAITGGAHLTFRGHLSVTIQAGSTVLSDPVALDVAPLGDLAIDLYLPGDSWGSTSPATIHTTGLTTSYVSATGNQSGAERLDVDVTTPQWFYLSRVDVWTPTAPGAIVTMGDSITDGTGSTVDAHRRWPDFLARRLAAEHGGAAPGVLNVGIAGNRVLSHNAGLAGILRRAGLPAPPDTGTPPNPNALFGPSGLSRFDRDALLQPGVTHVVVLETTNDIGMAFDDPWPSVEDLIAGHRTLIQRAHAFGLTIYGGTLLPFEGALYWTEAGEAKRQALNDWIRTSGAYDAVIDFAAAVHDPEHPSRFRPDLHADDWLHPNDAGYEAMANAIDLSLFDATASARTAGDTAERCMLGFNAGPPMLPSAYNNNIQILQTPDHVVILNEMIHDARIVPLGGAPHLPGGMRQWLGDSRGRWEGDTLVVESTNFTAKTGSFYTVVRAYGSGETLRLVERFTREGEDRLRYEFTIDDPATFTRAITGTIPMKRSDARLFEYACHEGNYGMTNLLAGARVQERRAAEAAAGDAR